MDRAEASAKRDAACKQAAQEGKCKRWQGCNTAHHDGCYGRCERNPVQWGKHLWCPSDEVRSAFYCEHRPCNGWKAWDGEETCAIWQAWLVDTEDDMQVQEVKNEVIEPPRIIEEPNREILERRYRHDPTGWLEEEHETYIAEFGQ